MVRTQTERHVGHATVDGEGHLPRSPGWAPKLRVDAEEALPLGCRGS